MNESLWMYFFMMMGIFGIVMINVFGQVLLSNEQNYYLLKESTEAAMYDAIDLNAYRGDGEWELGEGNSCVPKVPGTIKIIREKFVESFARRFANSANLDRQYRVIFNDIDECPPKVSISLIASERFSMLEIFNVTYDADTSIINNLSGIIEADLKNFDPTEVTANLNVCDGEKTSSDSYSEWSTCNYATNTQSRYKTTQYRVGSTFTIYLSQKILDDSYKKEDTIYDEVISFNNRKVATFLLVLSFYLILYFLNLYIYFLEGI